MNFLMVAQKEKGKLSTSYVFIFSPPMSEVTKTYPHFSIPSGLGSFEYVNTSIHASVCVLFNIALFGDSIFICLYISRCKVNELSTAKLKKVK